MKIIFLDIDGVLITRETCKQGFKIVDKNCVAALNDLIKLTESQIVLSSSWRMGRTVSECQELIDTFGVKGTVIDRTPAIELSRGNEISLWLARNQHLPINSFVIIDDDNDMFPWGARLCRTSMEHGFTQLHIQIAVDILNREIERITDATTSPAVPDLAPEA